MTTFVCASFPVTATRVQRRFHAARCLSDNTRRYICVCFCSCVLLQNSASYFEESFEQQQPEIRFLFFDRPVLPLCSLPRFPLAHSTTRSLLIKQTQRVRAAAADVVQQRVGSICCRQSALLLILLKRNGHFILDPIYRLNFFNGQSSYIVESKSFGSPMMLIWIGKSQISL